MRRNNSNAPLLATVSLAAALVLVPGLSVSAAQNSNGPSGPTFGSRTDKPDGTVALTVGRRLPTEWDTKFGLDASLAPEPALNDIALHEMRRSTGAIWGNMTGPGVAPVLYDKTTIDARVNAGDEQGRVAAAMSRTVPLGDGLSVTLRDEISVTQSLGGAAAADTQSAGSAWGVDRSLRLSLGATGTTLSAGTATSSHSTQWHNRLVAEQQISGPFSVQTSVVDPGTTASNKSITAGFKHKW